MIINLLDWDITYKEFTEWVIKNGADVYAVISVGANDPLTRYMFEKEEDLTAFKLTFSKEKPLQVMNYTGRSTIMNAYYYAPYIPIINEKS